MKGGKEGSPGSPMGHRDNEDRNGIIAKKLQLLRFSDSVFAFRGLDGLGPLRRNSESPMEHPTQRILETQRDTLNKEMKTETDIAT